MAASNLLRSTMPAWERAMRPSRSMSRVRGIGWTLYRAASLSLPMATG